MALDNVEIIVGTYEEFVLGYKLKYDHRYNLIQTFANHGHTASVRCVTSNAKMMASGGADETVHLYDMNKRKEAGVLMHHNGTVNCVEYSPDGSHLLTGGDDGMLAICRVGSFQLEKVWYTAHKSGIVGISVHPTGKLALSVGTDATLRTWNLVKGRQAYATRLGSTKCGAGWQITGVRWGPNGKLYAVGIGSKVDVYSVESAAIVYTVTTEMKISSFCFLNDDILCVGCEDGKIYIHNVSNNRCVSETKAHDQRIKCLANVVSQDSTYIISASSSGQIKLWKYTETLLRELCKVDTSCRITCLTVTTCFSTNIKEEDHLVDNIDDVKIEDEELKNYIPEGNGPVRPIRKEVVTVEEEEEQKEKIHLEAEKSSKRKKKKLNNSNLREEEDEMPAKKKVVLKTKPYPVTNASKKKLKMKKRKQSVGSDWKVTDVMR